MPDARRVGLIVEQGRPPEAAGSDARCRPARGTADYLGRSSEVGSYAKKGSGCALTNRQAWAIEDDKSVWSSPSLSRSWPYAYIVSRT